MEEYYQLLEAGADSVCILEREASFKMFSSLLSSLDLIPANVPITMSPETVLASTKSKSLPVLADWSTAPQEDESIINFTNTKDNIVTNNTLPFHEDLVNQFRQRAVDRDDERMRLKLSERTGWAADG